jgi:hypothetical protein
MTDAHPSVVTKGLFADETTRRRGRSAP